MNARVDELYAALVAVRDWAHGACPLFDRGQIAHVALCNHDWVVCDEDCEDAYCSKCGTVRTDTHIEAEYAALR